MKGLVRLTMLGTGLSLTLVMGCAHRPPEAFSADLMETNHLQKTTSPYHAHPAETATASAPAPVSPGPSETPVIAQMHYPEPAPSAPSPAPAPQETPTTAAVVPAARARQTGSEEESALPSPALTPPATPSAPAQPEDPLVKALRYYRENRIAEAQAVLQQCDPARKEALSVLLPTLARLGEQPSATELASLLDQCGEVSRKLRPRAALTLDKVCFCKSIDGFGMYDPLPVDHGFLAGQEGQAGDLVQVYLELRHFASQPRGTVYETSLASTLEIRDYRQQVVWRQDRPARAERSRTPRQDCFLNCYFHVPPRLPPGDYILVIQVKDVTGVTGREPPAHRIASRTLDFRVVNQRQERTAQPLSAR